MKTFILTLALGLLAVPALAQTPEEDARANAIVLPIVLGNIEGMPGASPYIAQIITACVVAIAGPEEKAALASATEATQELADQIVTPILNRPELASCITATADQQ